MSFILPKSSLAIESSLAHIKETSSEGSAIEAYLAQYLLVLLCAEIQQSIYDICRDRADKSSDEGVRNFAIAAVTKLLRSVDKKDLAGFVNHFGSDSKDKFNASLEDKDFQMYSNAVKKRHDVAHKGGAEITLHEVSKVLEVAEKVLNSVENSI